MNKVKSYKEGIIQQGTNVKAIVIAFFAPFALI